MNKYPEDTKEQQRLWQIYQQDENCPYCEGNEFTMRRMAETKIQDAHWRYSCKICKRIWRQPQVNTVEQA